MLHKILDNEQIEAIDNAVEAMEKCYYAMNTLTVKTRVSFAFAATDLLEAWKFCEAWKDKIMEGITNNTLEKEI